LLSGVENGYFGFRETIELPQDWKIISANKNTLSLTSSDLLILDEKGNVATGKFRHLFL